MSNATGIAHWFVFLSSKRPGGSSESVACLDYTRPTNDSPDSTGSGGPIPEPPPQVFGARLIGILTRLSLSGRHADLANVITAAKREGHSVSWEDPSGFNVQFDRFSPFLTSTFFVRFLRSYLI